MAPGTGPLARITPQRIPPGAITALSRLGGQIMAYRLSISRIDWNGELTEFLDGRRWGVD
jgi:hypothetical protein